MRKILFISGTRADYGKIKPLLETLKNIDNIQSILFVTGMHLQKKHGNSQTEIDENIAQEFVYYDNFYENSMELSLSRTIEGISEYIKSNKVDMIVVHGDRIEALAGAIVGAMRNIMITHIEGGEVSGTIDESIRHSISKLSHLHLVSNITSKKRLLQMGEVESSIYVIGSPDIDAMLSSSLPSIDEVKKTLNISFSKFGIFLYHPVTTDLTSLKDNIDNVVSALKDSNMNFIVIYPNNDTGSDVIINCLENNYLNDRFMFFKNIKFECFLTLLKNASCIIGNSSAGVREAPVYGTPSINLGSRQTNRANSKSIHHFEESDKYLAEHIKSIAKIRYSPYFEFGNGESKKEFIKFINNESVWSTDIQKNFSEV